MKSDKNRIISYLMYVRSEAQDRRIKVASCCSHGVSLYTTFFYWERHHLCPAIKFHETFPSFSCLLYYNASNLIAVSALMILPFPKNKAIITPTCNRLELGHGTLWERRFCCPWNKMGIIRKDQGVWLVWRWQKQKQCYPS